MCLLTKFNGRLTMLHEADDIDSTQPTGWIIRRRQHSWNQKHHRLSGLFTYGFNCLERQMSTPPMLQRGMVSFTHFSMTTPHYHEWPFLPSWKQHQQSRLFDLNFEHLGNYVCKLTKRHYCGIIYSNIILNDHWPDVLNTLEILWKCTV